MSKETKSEFAKKEEEVIDFWEKRDIFKKSLEQRKDAPLFSFYDGPPFASGLPHYGHILASTLKDTVTRYWTMRGYKVERTVGWDCHGLPVENLIEKELGVKTKKEILERKKTERESIISFNDPCRKAVFTCVADWKNTFQRIGRWADFSDEYATLENEYIETVWWVFAQLYAKELIYKDYKVSPYCARCGTPLSNFEVNQGYAKATDPSIYIKVKISGKDNEYFLVWTTTPWTLPGNVALAVGPDIEYAKVKSNDSYYYVAKNRLPDVAKYLGIDDPEKESAVFEIVRGKELEGLEYEPVFDFMTPDKKAYRVITGDFVSTEDGTGIVHIAPAFGEDDMRVGRENDLPILMTIDSEGKFITDITDWAGIFVKDADPGIIKNLQKRDILISDPEETIEHEYPFCWRCDSPLIYFALEAWYVAVTKIISDLVRNNAEIKLKDPSGIEHNGIRWVPEHIKDGRFGKWLEGVRDWNISRNRFWGAPIPVWICESCGDFKVVGSIKDLGDKKPEDLHLPYIDDVVFECQCGGKMKRTPEVFDCWFESGAMPYGQYHYPFEHKEKFEQGFPADFIAEGLDQTRGWFYTLHVLATALFNKPAFKNVVVNGLILAEDGKKLSKRLKNYTEPNILFDKVGVDAVRYFLMASTPIGEDYRFSDRLVEEMLRKTVMLMNNIYNFYALYEKTVKFEQELNPDELVNILDKWIVSKLQILTKDMTDHMDVFDLTKGSRPLLDFINELSTWYLRRSRDRFKGDDEEDKKRALMTLRYVLIELSKLCAPFMPFISEDIYRKINGPQESVHLESWPDASLEMIHKDLVEHMDAIRKIIEQALAVRADAGIKVRQPLGTLYITKKSIPEDLHKLIKDEVNAKDIIVADSFPESETIKVGADQSVKVALDIKLSDDLQREGHARELIRQINSLRKQNKLSIGDMVDIEYSTDSEELVKAMDQFGDDIKSSTLTKEFVKGKGKEKFDINSHSIKITLKM